MDTQAARNKVDWIISNKSKVIVIHYACGNIYDSQVPVRIGHISCLRMTSGQSKGFSFIDYKERHPTSTDDEVEKFLLEEFFHFVQVNKNWLHWNMKDSNYGFEALENRYKALGGNPTSFDSNKTINLATILKSIYGDDYARNPKMYDLSRLNNILPRNFLKGDVEADRFSSGNLREVGLSCNSKVGLFSHILNLIKENKLLVRKNRFDYFKSMWKWILAAISFLALILGLFNDSNQFLSNIQGIFKHP